MINDKHDYIVRGWLDGENTTFLCRGTYADVFSCAKEFFPAMKIHSITREVEWEDELLDKKASET